MHTYKIQTQRAFALPTLVLVGTILMIVGASTLVSSTSITKVLQDQHWQQQANNAAQAGVAFATDCLNKNKTNYWTNPLKPNSTCSGTSSAGTTLAEGEGWTSTFSVSVPSSGSSSEPSTTTSTGSVTLTALSKTYTAKSQIVIGVEGGGISAEKVRVSNDTVPFACTLASDMQVYCAGRNQYGQLGNGNTTNQSTPVKFNLPSGLTAIDISIGGYHTCVLASDSQIYCAGDGSSGQLGNGNTTNQSTPVKFNLPSGLTATQVSTGFRGTCAVTSNSSLSLGRVYCAGVNQYGQLGNGNTTNQSTPVLFNNNFVGSEFNAVINVTVGTSNICAAGNDTEMTGWAWTYCAGYGSYGALGNGGTSQSTTPIVFGGAGWNSSSGIQLGIYNTCAIGLSTTAWCSGANHYGQLGNGTTNQANSPVGFGGSFQVLAFATFQGTQAEHICVIRTTSNMYCAGRNQYGQLGNGNTTNQSTPVIFNLPVRAVRSAVTSGLNTCAIAARNNQVYCAGNNNYGQLGNGNTTNQSTPAKFNLPSNVTAKEVTLGYENTCAVASDSQVYCAGRNNYGQLGNGNTTNQSTPVKFQLP